MSPRIKKSVELLKFNPNLKVVDAIFAASLPESEATSKTIQKRVLQLRDEISNKNPVVKLKKTNSIPSVVKESSSDKRPLSPITVSTGVSNDAR